MIEKARESWTSRLGFILAAAGSAVGLGNIWRFPYVAGMNGGSAFIVVYFFIALVVGLSIMVAEFTLGRYTKLSAVGAFKSISKRWTFAGFLGFLTAFIIMGFYPVVGGWTLAYAFKSVTGLLRNAETLRDAFGKFITSPVEPIFWLALFLAFNVIIVARGISKGIELANKILMPSLLLLLLAIGLRSWTLPGASGGLEFLFKPDFSKINGNVLLAALGQAFFSLSLGMGCMITYGSYLKKEENIPASAFVVTAMDTLIAILAGLVIFPAVFAFGVEPATGPGLVFIVVPQVFAKLGVFGPLFSLLFFLALFVAALTSSISLLEVAAAYFIDQKGWNRKKAVLVSSAIMFFMSILSSLSLGVLSGFTILGVGFFDLFDLLSDKVFLTVGGLLVAIFVTWVVKKENIHMEVTNNGTVKFPFALWYNLVKYVIPVLIGIITVTGIISAHQPAVMVLGILIVILAAIFSHKL
ncbi:sodium-dependent transporter [Pseudothermotoga thermarum]|uniref:Sodium:neurotransmitter symporter n=1 Tax=Pseudothermotoga thermarum DSM 5069 TaxID=688269 RepID=F7YUY4_9THEM|nr:sodium-dependent transporter [Pseudothermotoga thermarum]AEH51548.1 sodium:neurotransmitter symporter [Pseudothermotoga thermarum DSM 5069]